MMLATPLGTRGCILILFLYGVGCSYHTSCNSTLDPSSISTLGQKATLSGLTKVDWIPENIESLDKFIKTYGKESPSYNPDIPPLAIFDWDNTMILNDIGDALFFYLVDNLGFSFNQDFWTLIPEKHRSALRQSYQEIKEVPSTHRTTAPSYQAYRKRFITCYFEIAQDQGNETAYQWIVQILTGLTTTQIKAATEAALNVELYRPIAKENIGDGALDRSPISINTGIRYYQPMAELVQKLNDAGFEVWIVSASVQWAVEIAAQRIGIDATRVLGVLPEVGIDNTIVSKIRRFTYRQGKANAIQQEIGRLPVFVAGDHNTDLEMLLLGTGLRLVIDRGKQPLMDTARKNCWLIQKPFLVPIEEER